MITVTSLVNGLHDKYFGGGPLQTLKDHSVAFLKLYTEPDDVKSGLTSGAIPVLLFHGILLLWFLLGLIWDGAFSNGMSFFGTLSFIGMVFFSWIGSYFDDITIQLYSLDMWLLSDSEKDSTIAAIEADIYFGGLGVWLGFLGDNQDPRRVDKLGVYDVLGDYQVSLIVKTILNITGWVGLFLFYGEFQDHIDYMDNLNNATDDDLLKAEQINCVADNGKVAAERCQEIQEIMEEEAKTEDKDSDDSDEDSDDSDEDSDEDSDKDSDDDSDEVSEEDI